jgi:hypothetical protein
MYIKKIKASDLTTNAFYVNFYSREGVRVVKDEVHNTLLGTRVHNPYVRSYLTLISQYGSRTARNWSYLRNSMIYMVAGNGHVST